MRKLLVIGLVLATFGCGRPDAAKTAVPPADVGPATSAKNDEPVMKGKKLSEWVAELNSKERSTRLSAIGALLSLGEKAQSATPALIPLLKDEDDDVRTGALEAMAQIGGPQLKQALPELAELLKDPLCVSYSIGVLTVMGPDAKPAVPHLLELMKGKNEKVRKLAADALKKIDPESAAKAGAS